MADSDAGWLDVSSTATRIAYTATAGQTVFAVPFEFLDEDHLSVTVNDVAQTLSTDYSTSGAGDEGGGSITFNDGLQAGDSVVIALAVPYELGTHIPPSGDLDIGAINLQFSLFVMMLKQLVANQTRSIRQPDSDEDDLSALPVKADRLGKFLAFHPTSGDVMLAASVTGAAVSAFMETFLAAADADAAKTALGITTSASDLVNWQTFH
jgi:hypothetical protein